MESFLTLKEGIKLFDHQKEYLEFAKKHKFTLCGDQMGLGKTLSAIAVGLDVKSEKTLVICPAFLKHNWKSEYLKFTNIPENKISIDKQTQDSMVVITSYSKLGKASAFFDWADFVIGDEAHMAKNLEAKRTQYFHEGLSQGSPEYLSLLTGTAVKNRVGEFYSLLKLLSHPENGKDITDKFRTQYQFSKYFSHERVFSIPRGGRRIEVRKFEGLKNEQELRTYFRNKYMRRLTRDVINLPELLERYVDVHYKYDDKELKEYEKHKGKIDGHIMAVKRGSSMAKAPFTADYAKNVHDETGRPVVIFSDHVDPVDIICGKLKNAARITGNTLMPERHKIVSDFQSGKLDYLVATIGAASTGLTLTAASDLIFNDMSYIPANNAQASKRIHRIGQNNTCRIHKICGSHIDKMIMTSLTSKQSVIDKVL